MDTLSPFALASMLLTAPAWAQLGITAPSQRLRQEAALELATVIVERLEASPVLVIEGQLALPL